MAKIDIFENNENYGQFPENEKQKLSDFFLDFLPRALVTVLQTLSLSPCCFIDFLSAPKDRAAPINPTASIRRLRFWRARLCSIYVCVKHKNIVHC